MKGLNLRQTSIFRLLNGFVSYNPLIDRSYCVQNVASRSSYAVRPVPYHNSNYSMIRYCYRPFSRLIAQTLISHSLQRTCLRLVYNLNNEKSDALLHKQLLLAESIWYALNFPTLYPLSSVRRRVVRKGDSVYGV